MPASPVVEIILAAVLKRGPGGFHVVVRVFVVKDQGWTIIQTYTCTIVHVLFLNIF